MKVQIANAIDAALDRREEREMRKRTFRGLRQKVKGLGGGCIATGEPCMVCGAPDSRAPDHARGCPELPAVSKQEMLRIAQNCERGWAERHQKARTAGA